MNYYHFGSMGDIIYALPAIRANGEGYLYLRKDNHLEALKRLLEEQPYVRGVFSSNELTKSDYVDLNKYRKIELGYFNTGTVKHLAECHLEAVGKRADLTQRWLFVKPLVMADVVVHRSTRYHDKEEIDYCMLQGMKVVFIGFDTEYKWFCRRYFTPKRYYCRDALDMAEVIAGSKLFVGNQSLGFAIAEALKHPRVLEVFHGRPNCLPIGENGHTKLSKSTLEWYCGKV